MLAHLVASTGYLRSDFGHSREVALPSGTSQLLVNLHSDELHSYPLDGSPAVVTRGAAIQGPHSRPVLIDPADQRDILWVSFRVGGLHPFLPAGMADLRDTMVDLADLWGRDGATLRERLLHAPADQRQRLLEQVLVAHAARPLEHNDAVRAAATDLHRGVPVGAAADRLGWTPQRLGRLFAEHVGLTPKRFARVRRFQRLVRAATGQADPDWARLAAEAGYHDQAHLIHEFRAHADRTPGDYRPRSAAEPNHVPVAISTIADDGPRR